MSKDWNNRILVSYTAMRLYYDKCFKKQQHNYIKMAMYKNEEVFLLYVLVFLQLTFDEFLNIFILQSSLYSFLFGLLPGLYFLEKIRKHFFFVVGRFYFLRWSLHIVNRIKVNSYSLHNEYLISFFRLFYEKNNSNIILDEKTIKHFTTKLTNNLPIALDAHQKLHQQ